VIGVNPGVFLCSEPNDGFQLFDKRLRNYPYAIPHKTKMRRFEAIRDSERKGGNSPIPKTAKDAKGDDHRCITQGITRALTGAAKD
jgi:hypothetical protein